MKHVNNVLKLKKDIKRIKKLETINKELECSTSYDYTTYYHVLRIQFLYERMQEILNERWIKKLKTPRTNKD